MGEGSRAYLTPYRIHTPWQIIEKFVASSYVGDPYGCAKFGANPSTGGFWANEWNITIFFNLYLFHELTYRSDLVDGFSRLMAQTTRTRASMHPLGVSLILLLILEVKNPQNPNFWGMNRRFPAKRAKYWKFHVFETTVSILTKFGKR